MAKSGTPYLKQRSNGTWYIQWTDANRVSQKVSTGTKDHVEAKEALGRFLLEENKAPLPTGAMLTVGQAWEVYWEKHVLKEGTTSAKTIASCWGNLQPHFATLLVSQAKGAVEKYVRLRMTGKLGRKKAASGTVRKECLHLIAALNFCCQPKYEQRLFPPELIDNIIVFVPGESEPRDRWLREHEQTALLAAAAEGRRGGKLSRVELFLWLALETAGRVAALLDLTWDRVDWETNSIHLAVPGRRQTSKHRPSVPISKRLLPVLRRAYAERQDQRPDALLLGHKGPVWESVNRVAVRAGIAGDQSDATKATGVSPHVLRHTAASMMARRGVPLFKIAKILGNSIRMVEKVYAKFQLGDLQDAVDTISGSALRTIEAPAQSA